MSGRRTDAPTAKLATALGRMVLMVFGTFTTLYFVNAGHKDSKD